MDAAEDLLEKEMGESPREDASEGTQVETTEEAQTETTEEAHVPAFGTPIPLKATTGGLKSGTIVTGMVTSVSPRELELDLGEGRTAVIGSRHWTSGLEVDLTGEVRKGDPVSAAVLVREDHKNRIVLSRSWGLQLKAWQEASEAMEAGKLVEGTVTDAGKPGWTVNIGIRAFVPASLAGGEDPEAMLGKTAEFKVVEVKQSQNRCILSRTAAKRTLERRADRKRLKELKTGNLARAVVTEVHGRGAVVLVDERFVSLIRRSELSWSHVRRTEAVVKVGEELQVKVLDTNLSKMKIDVSLRLGEDPFLQLDRSRRYEGTVKSLTPAGAYVSIDLDSPEDGVGRSAVEGLVSNEELVEYPIRHPGNVVVPGDRVAVQVLRFSRRSRQLDLSVNQAMLLRPSEAVRNQNDAEDSREGDSQDGVLPEATEVDGATETDGTTEADETPGATGTNGTAEADEAPGED